MITKIGRADRVVLSVDWEQFENLLRDLGDRRAAKVAYLDNALEIRVPLPEHEYWKTAISLAIENITEELDIDYESYGSTTWKREAKLAGVEPDNCFHFQNERQVRGKLDFDLDKDPPPDLVLEIDLTSKSLNRFPIYARLGIPELWCYDAGELKLYRLENNTYQEVAVSAVFPSLPLQELPALIEQYRHQGRRAFRSGIRDWVQKNKS